MWCSDNRWNSDTRKAIFPWFEQLNTFNTRITTLLFTKRLKSYITSICIDSRKKKQRYNNRLHDNQFVSFLTPQIEVPLIDWLILTSCPNWPYLLPLRYLWMTCGGRQLYRKWKVIIIIKYIQNKK